MTTHIIDIINKSLLRLFTKRITDSSIITTEYIKNIHKPPTNSENKMLWILEGEIGSLSDLLNILETSFIYIDNYKCYLDRISRFLIISNYHEFLRGELEDLEPTKHAITRISTEEMKKLIEYVENTYPFNVISTRKVTKIEDIEKLLVEYCNKHRLTEDEHPEMEEFRSERIIEILDDILWNLTGQKIVDTNSMILETRKDSNFMMGVGYVDSIILLITTLKDKGYPVKDYILEGKELLLNLKNALEIKLDIELGIERSEKDLKQLDIILDLINTYPLNKIISGELAEYGPDLLRDYLLRKQLIITPEMLIPPKKTISINIDSLKNLLDEVLKENLKAKITIDFSIYEIEKILESTQYAIRYDIKDDKEAVVYTTLFEAIITDDFNISFIPFYYEPKPISTPKNRIYANINLESYKNILGNAIRNNPNSIIGDIIIEDTKDLKDLVDILIESNAKYVIKIDILQKDQDIIRELYKTIDIADMNISEIILKSTIHSVEISDVFNIDKSGSEYRLLILHINKERLKII